MSKVYSVKAKIERKGISPYWMSVGVATEVSDGKIICTLDALPLHSKGVLMLWPKEKDVDIDPSLS